MLHHDRHLFVLSSQTMRIKLLTLIGITALAMMAIWSFSESNQADLIHTSPVTQSSVDPATHSDIKPTQGRVSYIARETEPALASQQNQFDRIEQVKYWLENNQIQTAHRYVNDHYSELSRAELERIKTFFLTGEPSLTQLVEASKIFDELDVWEAVTNAALRQRDWDTSYTALMRASELENSSTKLEEKLETLIKVASHLRAELEGRGDELGIKELYQNAYELHPTYPRFQLELAYAHIRIGEDGAARQLLTQLQYEPELGEIAKQALDRIDSSEPQIEENNPTIPSQITRNDIVVPLVRSGNSFFVNTSVNNRNARLLLDTGASITALSSKLIKRLNLQPTGQTIKLSTANGERHARLFHTDKLKLGRIQLNGLVVAEINLERAQHFEGLLGTDALNQPNSDYTYLIDNEENALIFRRR